METVGSGQQCGALKNAGEELDLEKGGRLHKLFNWHMQDAKRASGSREAQRLLAACDISD
jgi:hypothetical protein